MSNISRIINPSSLSFETIKADIEQYLQSRSDYDSWKDFYESGVGTTEIELMAGLASYLAYHAIGSRRETFIDTRKLYSSALNIANTLGYPVNRLSAPRYNITFNSPNSFYLDRSIPLATYNSFELTPLYSRTIMPGVNTVECVLGTWNTFEYTSDSSDNFQMLSVLSENIDNNRFGDTLELFINGIQVDLVDYAEEMLNNSVLIRTSTDGILLIFGDGTLGYRLRNNDELKFNYIQAVNPQNFLTLNPLSLVSSYNISFSNFELLETGSEKDGINKLAALPQGYFASKRRMVTGSDHKAMLLSYSGNLISANYVKESGTCCTVLLSYLFNDEHLVNDAEKALIINYLDNFKMIGSQINLTHPVRKGVACKFIIVIEESASSTDITNKLVTLINEQTMQLGETFHSGILNTTLSKLNGVVRVYPIYPSSDKELQYNVYMKFINYSLTFTTNMDYTISTTPTNEGYYDYVDDGNITTQETGKLICDTAHFSSIADVRVNDLVVIKGNLIKSARVVSVDSDTQLTLSSDIFTESGAGFEIYRAC